MTPWATLRHARGTAEEVPEWLEALGDEPRREVALHRLRRAVFDEGRRCALAAEVVTALLDRVAAGVEWAEAITLATHLIAGLYGLGRNGVWCDGVALHRWDGSVGPASIDPDRDEGCDPDPDRPPVLESTGLAEIWRCGQARLPVVLGLLDHRNLAVRGAAAFFASLYVGEPAVAAALRGRREVDRSAAVRADLWFALRPPEPPVGLDPTVQLVASFLRPTDPGAVEVLVTGLSDPPGFRAVTCRSHWTAADVAGRGLLAAPREAVLAVRSELFTVLARTTVSELLIPVTAVLLGTAFPAPLEGPPDPVQREVLEALLAKPAVWPLLNLADLFEQAGIPWDRDEVTRLARGG